MLVDLAVDTSTAPSCVAAAAQALAIDFEPLLWSEQSRNGVNRSGCSVRAGFLWHSFEKEVRICTSYPQQEDGCDTLTSGLLQNSSFESKNFPVASSTRSTGSDEPDSLHSVLELY